MNRGLIVFLGSVLTFASAWLGLVILPYWQLNAEEPYRDSASREAYPQPLSELAQAGKGIYQAYGCMYCHSQQVRSQHFASGADIARGWGQRRTVSRDYLYDRPILLGTMRTGPDLAAIAERNASPSWHHEHLLNPRAKNAWSIMPSFAFLYERRPIVDGQRSPEALTLGREWTVIPGRRYRPTAAQWTEVLAREGDKLLAKFRAANPSTDPPQLNSPESSEVLLRFWLASPEDQYEVVPTESAHQLVAYLLELRKTAMPLPEAIEE